MAVLTDAALLCRCSVDRTLLLLLLLLFTVCRQIWAVAMVTQGRGGGGGLMSIVAGADHTWSFGPDLFCPLSLLFLPRVVFPDPPGELTSWPIVCRSQIGFPDVRARGRARRVYFCCFHLPSILYLGGCESFSLLCATRLIY